MAPYTLLCHFVEGELLNVTPLYECPIDRGVAAHFSLGRDSNRVKQGGL